MGAREPTTTMKRNRGKAEEQERQGKDAQRNEKGRERTARR